uniref:TRAF3 interacting protein 3 n=1 Tax=Neogobius melanostomus TaxID=47308 RepID=A0A8C6WQG4_9GOBI
MDAVASGKVHLSTLNFEEKSLIRAEQHEHRRGRNNTTSCRSPTREIDTKLIKNELKEKRQLEFLKRRSVSPEMCGSKSGERQAKRRASPRIFTMRRYTSESVDTNASSPATNGRPVIISERSLSESPSSSKWTSLWSDQIKDNTTASKTQDSNVLKGKSTVNVRTKSIRSERVQQRLTQQSEFIQVKKLLREASVQTESGFVTVRETDLQKLADYLQEALWREDILKKKLASLQESTANLMNSTDKIWTSRCSEDLLRSKIRALEAQLQVCLQKFPKDAVKKLFLQMERQKLVYEDQAVIALQNATQEKTEAVTKADTLQGALNTALTEAQRWQRLYEELKLSSEQLRLKQDQSNDQLQRLLDQLELSRVREGELSEELVSLKQHNQELRYNICLLEEDNDVLREEIQQLRDGTGETEELLVQQVLTSEEPEQGPKTNRSSEVEEQLQHTLKKLQLKEKECEVLQTELSAMEQECQSTQSRLAQCREQLRQTTHRPRTTDSTCAGGCWWLGLCLSLMVLLALAGGMLGMWFPPFREQLQDFYSDFYTRIEDYLLEMSSPQHSGCFRPV